MKILKLTIAGFGPFKNEQVVDFEAFDDAGLFLITGRTGAGKSSILDAICYALYDGVPRYETSQQRLRSDYSEPGDPTFVELEFSIGAGNSRSDEGRAASGRAERYRVRRTPAYEKPKQRGEGLTTAAATAQLARLVDGQWQGMSARAGDVAHDLQQLIGLSKSQFLQVILLAQNRFQQFLRAGNDERQAVLRTLFGSQRFEQIEKSLDEMRKALEGELADADRALAGFSERAAQLLDLEPAETATSAAWFDERLAALLAQQQDATATATTSDFAFESADMEVRSLGDALNLQRRRDSAAATLAVLDSDAPAVTAARTELAAARRAASVWPLLDATVSSAATLDRARAGESDALAAWLPFDSATAADAPDAALDDRVASLTATLGALADVLASERTLPAVRADEQRCARELAATDATIAASSERMSALPAEIDAVTALVTGASVEAARETDAAEAVIRATAALDAAVALETAGHALERASVAERQASSSHTAACVALDTLLDRRLLGHAAELASVLVDGEACAVCGSPSHPSPAARGSEPVSASDIAEARELITRKRSALDAAHEAYAAASAAVADATARSLGKSAADLDDELAVASDRLALASAAGARAAALGIERDTLLAELSELEKSHAGLRARRESAVALLADAASRRGAIESRIDQNRGDHDTVTERVAALDAELAAARTLVAARSALAGAEAADALARATLDAEVAAQQFGDADEARSSRRQASEVARLESLIREHDQSRATANATLDEPGIELVPEHPIDIEPARAERAAALVARDAARAAAAALAERVARMRDIVHGAGLARASTEAARAEFDQLRALAGVVRGDEPNTRRMRLETFVLAAQLEEIVAAANARLVTMTGGRYALEHDDGLQFRNAKSGLGLAIRDEYTGRSRATNSLSGGETFLASLALALGLAEVVTNQAGGISLDTLFIDEGFGSLDSDTLEVAMSTLDGLRNGGRTIGLISHVEGMKEQITAKLSITVTPHGHSEIDEIRG